jgi:hypothetical protein
MQRGDGRSMSQWKFLLSQASIKINRASSMKKISTHSSAKIKNKFHGGDRRSRAASFSFIKLSRLETFWTGKRSALVLKTFVASSSPRATRFSVFFSSSLVPGSPHISSFSIVHREPNEKKNCFFSSPSNA